MRRNFAAPRSGSRDADTRSPGLYPAKSVNDELSIIHESPRFLPKKIGSLALVAGCLPFLLTLVESDGLQLCNSRRVSGKDAAEPRKEWRMHKEKEVNKKRLKVRRMKGVMRRRR